MPHIPLSTTSPTGALDDLAPFLELAATRSVIGLGEATHGTRDAFELKHRLIRALAEHGALRTVAFECGLAPARLIDDYVRWGRGAAREALEQQGYWCWENEEVLALIEWLREHNTPLAPDERIAFVGVDVQRVELGLPELVGGLAASAPEQGSRPEGTAREALDVATAAARQLLEGELERHTPEAKAAAHALAEVAPTLATPELRALCRNVARYVDTYLNPEHEDGLALRDEYMAATVLEALAERPGLMAVWAHNEHVAVNPDFFGTRAMGHHLRDALGDGYLALGMLFGEGSFLARSWEERPHSKVSEFRVGSVTKEHDEHRFVGRSLGLFESVKVPPAAARYRRFLGSLYDHEVNDTNPEAFRVERPITDFDLVAWLPETRAARHLRAVAS